jgi:hypothetical protein
MSAEHLMCADCPGRKFASREEWVADQNRHGQEEALRDAVDLLWGHMPAEQVRELREDQPEIVEIARANHERLWHTDDGPAGQRYVSVDSELVLSGRALNAILTAVWHTGHTAAIRYEGTHAEQEMVQIGPHEFHGGWSKIAPRLIAWEKILRQREANQPIPGPPDG